jgi:hypothetical protein
MPGWTTLAVGTILAVGLVSAVALLLAGESEQPSAVVEPRPTYSGSLESLLRNVPTRDEFRVCVDGAGGYEVGAREIDLVTQALDEAFHRMRDYPHSVTEGCDPPTGITGEQLWGNGMSSPQSRFIRRPDAPGSFVAEVFFLPSSALDAAFKISYPFSLVTEAYVCEGDVCGGVTGGIYVAPDITPDLMAHAFLSMNGLEDNPLDACYGDKITERPYWCAELWRRTGESPSR